MDLRTDILVHSAALFKSYDFRLCILLIRGYLGRIKSLGCFAVLSLFYSLFDKLSVHEHLPVLKAWWWPRW
mgnify:CR=1 FL=1